MVLMKSFAARTFSSWVNWASMAFSTPSSPPSGSLAFKASSLAMLFFISASVLFASDGENFVSSITPEAFSAFSSAVTAAPAFSFPTIASASAILSFFILCAASDLSEPLLVARVISSMKVSMMYNGLSGVIPDSSATTSSSRASSSAKEMPDSARTNKTAKAAKNLFFIRAFQ